jgi:predicted fused transcriptional regulator/phosphomethylpyrimidine kinase
MRFPNEAQALKDNGFMLVRIDRNNRPSENRAIHESENAMNNFKDWDMIIDNNGHLEDFYEQLQKLVQVIKISQKYNIK